MRASPLFLSYSKYQTCTFCPPVNGGLSNMTSSSYSELDGQSYHMDIWYKSEQTISETMLCHIIELAQPEGIAIGRPQRQFCGAGFSLAQGIATLMRILSAQPDN